MLQGGSEQAPVYVIVLDHASPGGRQGMAIKELPANSTVSQLHELLQLQRAALQANGPATYLLVRPVHACACAGLPWSCHAVPRSMPPSSCMQQCGSVAQAHPCWHRIANKQLLEACVASARNARPILVSAVATGEWQKGTG